MATMRAEFYLPQSYNCACDTARTDAVYLKGIMKTLATLFAVLITASAPVFAGPCVALDYQEMKDMSTDELLKEACSARSELSRALDETISNLDSIGGRLTFPNAQENFDQCNGQITRIDRVLTSKGMSKEQIIAACRDKKAEAQSQK